MYQYKTLTPRERQQLVEERRAKGYPPHRPPHPIRDRSVYLLTAACYRHHRYLPTPERRQELLDVLFAQFVEHGMAIRGWAILPNHYHLLVHVPNFDALGKIFGLVHGRTAHDWNAEDGTRGRKVWYSYADRAIRSERHYATTLNYIHYNPVKHGLVSSPYDWASSSVHWYLKDCGREWLRDLWQRYPIRDYGVSWDHFELLDVH